MIKISLFEHNERAYKKLIKSLEKNKKQKNIELKAKMKKVENLIQK